MHRLHGTPDLSSPPARPPASLPATPESAATTPLPGQCSRSGMKRGRARPSGRITCTACVVLCSGLQSMPATKSVGWATNSGNITPARSTFSVRREPSWKPTIREDHLHSLLDSCDWLTAPGSLRLFSAPRSRERAVEGVPLPVSDRESSECISTIRDLQVHWTIRQLAAYLHAISPQTSSTDV